MPLHYLGLVAALLASDACGAGSRQARTDSAAAVERARLDLGLAGSGQSTAAAVRLEATTLPFLASQIASLRGRRSVTPETAAKAGGLTSQVRAGRRTSCRTCKRSPCCSPLTAWRF